MPISLDYPSTPQQLAEIGEWETLDTAPKDGTPIQVEIPGHGADNIIAWTSGFVDTEGRECSCWMFIEDQEPPSSWTDGICWVVNEDGVPSTLPTRWKPLPDYPKR
jgi:hypothetical protein